jgi:DUF1365 family protein
MQMSAAPIAWLGSGSIRHARLRPARNRFAYAAWFLRLPLRSMAQHPHSIRWLKRNQRGLFALNDADHGDGRPLLAWIDALLRAEGVVDATGEVWLHTVPRVLGFVFNPVSFWFCERTDGGLRAVVCEVNNTFGERHCYLLAHPDGRAIRWGEELCARKVFHVSPFCQVEGHYRFRFLLARSHPAERPRFVARIDYDDAGGPLLQTSIGGELAPLTDALLLRTLITHPAFTIGVIARIHWQALRLWAKRVPFTSKPRPPEQGVTRSRIDPSASTPS